MLKAMEATQRRELNTQKNTTLEDMNPPTNT